MTGRATVETLAGLDAEIMITDTRTDLAPLAASLEAVQAAGATFVPPGDLQHCGAATAVVSPGLSTRHPVVETLRAGGAEIISEIELAFRLLEGTMVAVTGTNGKTTVTGLTGHVLSAAYGDVRVTGNIGEPLIGAVADSTPDSMFVTEVSSYQLETCSTFRPRVATVLNVQEDHLERHGNMDSYAAAKRRLVETQGAGDTALLNGDDSRVRAMADHTGADVLFLSTRGETDRGAFVSRGSLVIRADRDVTLADTAEMLLKGEHNHLNALAAGAAAWLLNVPDEDIRRRLCDFKGFPHRIEPVKTVRGVEYVNDSKSTNTDSTLAALRTFEGRSVILILGGDDKGLDYSVLYDEIKGTVSHVIVLGPGLRRMASELRAAGFESVETADDMERAVSAAAADAEPGDVVLLSPASSSFDLFDNYEHRGMCFKDAVKSI